MEILAEDSKNAVKVLSGFRNSSLISSHIIVQLLLNIIIILKVYTFMKILLIFIHYQGFKTYIINTSNVNCEQSLIQEL